jgi:RND family efflux transporter MFP subunit
MKRFFVIIVILALVGGLGWKIYQKIVAAKPTDMGPKGNPAVPVEAASVSKATLRDIEFFTGTLLPESQFTVAPKIAGRLEKLKVNIGDPVKNGQLIAELEDDEYSQKLEEDTAKLEVTKATVGECASSLEGARKEFERVKELRQKNAASDSDFDRAEEQFKINESKYKVALARVIQDEASLKSSQIRLSYTKIYAAWDKGEEDRVLGERFVDEGAMLAPNTLIVSILDIEPLRAIIHVIERDYSSVKIGQSAKITTDAFPGETFFGKIVRVAPLLMESSRQARVEIEIPNKDRRLKPGMFIRAEIEFGIHTDVTVVPVSALSRYHGTQGVFLVEGQNKKARFVPVTQGIVEGDLAEILNPPLSGSVVTVGQHLLEDGSSIILPDLTTGEKAKQGKDSQAPDKEAKPSQGKGT